MVKAMKDKIVQEPVYLEEHLEEMFNATQKAKEEVGDLVDILVGALQDKSPLFMLSVFTNAAVKIVSDHAPSEEYATATLEGITEAMKRSLQMMIDENVCGFQQTKQ